MSELTRRQFIKRTTAVGAACTIGFPSLLRGRGLNEKLQVGFVATEGRANAHTKASHEAGLQCIAFAEVDRTRWGGVLQKEGWSEAKGCEATHNDHHQARIFSIKCPLNNTMK